MRHKMNQSGSLALACVVCLLAAGPGCAQKAEPHAPPAQASSPAKEPGTAAERFKALGKSAPLTVFPTRLAGRPMAQVGLAVAMFLERSGMTDLETSDAAFDPPEGADLGQTAKAFGEFVKAHPIATEYALFADFMGSPQAGLTELRGVVVNKAGEIAWQDRQTKGDADFERVKPREPMQCCLLLVDRLRPVLGLGDPASDKAPEGKIAERMRKGSGVPDKAELAAIEQRGQAFKKASAGASVMVYPAHAGDSFSAASATSIAAMLSERKLMRATAATDGPRITPAADMNEQKMLWAMAHALSEQVKKNPPPAGVDYVLYADYLMGKDHVGGVHLAICNRQGELVVVDFQNDHHNDFQAINPKTREDCDRLLVKRVEQFCK